MILACIIGCLALIVPPLFWSGRVARIGVSESRRSYESQFTAGALVLVGSATFAIAIEANSEFFGFSLILCWIAPVICFVGALCLYLNTKDCTATTSVVPAQGTTIILNSSTISIDTNTGFAPQATTPSQ
uniref:Uncharacterized protein LOC102804252 n=1 Tax=Saccoglossus kowalevskii TaxID=10224 RepID=A0ABM0ME05_SACKO|nr:PREDICTED: uncharacterized protein LOC102804252 [Saccoglossus kowalevskii]